MMYFISHRGNINGQIPARENTEDYIDEALLKGYDVEIDIWCVDDELFLGHDKPENKVEVDWLENRHKKLWIHCKNIEAMSYFKNISANFNYFWHQNDDVTITSLGYFWTYPGKKLTMNSIAVLPEISNYKDIDIAIGVCSDEIKTFQES